MAFELFPVVQWFDNSGLPLSGGLISTFVAGSTTPQATYTDSTGGTPQANPVVLDSAGRAQIWFAAASYKLVLKTAAGVTLMTIDNVTLDNLAATISSLTMTGALVMQQPTAATNVANQSSNTYSLQGTYWNGAASATDQFQWQDVIGTGANPTATLTLSHSGTSGVASLDVSAVPLKANIKTLNAIRFADQFTGADMGAKITAAIADLPSTGGIVDATAFQGTQTAAATINVSKPCLVKLGAVTLQLSGAPGINLSNTGAAVLGLGPGATILQVNTGTNDAIQSNAINVMAKGFTVNSLVARTAGAGIRCKGGNGVYEDFTIDSTFNGIQITDSLSGASGNNVFKRIVMGSLTSPAGSWNAGIILGGVASGTVTGEFFQDVIVIGTSAFADAMLVLDSGCDTNHFTDCQFVQSGVDSNCLSIRNTSTSNDPQWDKFNTCVFEAGNTKTGVTVSAGILTNFINCSLATCNVFFQFNGGKSIHVTECKLIGCQRQAVNITAGTDIKLVNNRIADSSILTNGGFNAIQVTANVNDFSIIGNDFTTILSSANQPFNNVSVPAGTSDRYWIYGNTFANSTGAGLSDAGTGTNKFVGLNSPFSVGNNWNGPQLLAGLVTKYNNIATVSNGIPSELATVDLTAQTAAVGTTTLYAVPASGAGQYRLSWDAKVTTAAGTSSTLGALTIVYTDPDGVVQTITAPATIPAGTIATTNAGNTTTSSLLGMPLVLNCKASTNITYAMAYASNAAAAMNYNLHIKLEAM